MGSSQMVECVAQISLAGPSRGALLSCRSECGAHWVTPATDQDAGTLPCCLRLSLAAAGRGFFRGMRGDGQGMDVGFHQVAQRGIHGAMAR